MPDSGAGGDRVVKPLSRIAQLSAAFLCSNLARAGIGLALALVLGRALGPVRFGAWILCTAWASTLTVVADLGFGVLLTRDGARGDSDPARLLSGALVLRLAAAIPLACALAAAADRLGSDPETVGALRVAALLGAAGAAYGCFGALLRSQPRWLPHVLAIETAWLAAQVAGSWYLVRSGFGVVALAALAAGLQLAQIATALVFWRRVFGEREAARFAPPPALLPLLRRALPFAVSGVVANLEARVAPLMLGALAAPADVGWFGAASRVGRAVKLAPQAMFAGALPVLAQEYQLDADAASRASSALDRLLMSLSMAAAIACAIAAPFLMRLVFGAPFAAAAPTLVWVAIGLVPSLSNSSRKVFLYAVGGEAIAVRWSAAALVLQIAFSALLIRAFGSAGAAMAIVVAETAIWWPLRGVPARTKYEVRSMKYEVR
jgi:O-antigen/teichoic acid export membrane protein